MVDVTGHTCGLFICNNTSDYNIRAHKNVKHYKGLGSNLSATNLGMRKTNNFVYFG